MWISLPIMRWNYTSARLKRIICHYSTLACRHIMSNHRSRSSKEALESSIRQELAPQTIWVLHSEISHLSRLDLFRNPCCAVEGTTQVVNLWHIDDSVLTLVVVGMSWVTSFRLCRWGTSSNHKLTWGQERKCRYIICGSIDIDIISGGECGHFPILDAHISNYS